VAAVTEVEEGSTAAAEGSTGVEEGSTEVEEGSTEVEEGSTEVEEGSTAAAPMPMVDTPAATMAVDTTAGAGATTGVADIGVTLVTVVTATAGDSALASAGGGHTGILTDTGTALGGDTHILIIHLVFLAIHARITETTIRPHPIPARNPETTGRILLDLPRRQDLRTTHLVMVRMMSQGVPLFPLIG
jgi:hypothetical protein